MNTGEIEPILNTPSHHDKISSTKQPPHIELALKVGLELMERFPMKAQNEAINQIKDYVQSVRKSKIAHYEQLINELHQQISEMP